MRLSSYPFYAMGTECVLHLGATDCEVGERAVEEVLRIERKFSRYYDDSIVSEINRASLAGASIELDAETARLLDYAFACWKKSEGLFDVTTGVLRRVWDFKSRNIPSRSDVAQVLALVGMEKLSWNPPVLSFAIAGVELDFGGLGKEYAVDRAIAVCAEAGAVHGLVDLGGDVRALGSRPDGEPWAVKIRHPRQHTEVLTTIPLTDAAIATSGDYERYIECEGQRYCHILNPKTGWPVVEFQSVTVVAKTCLLAGSLSTIAMVRGLAACDWLTELRAECLWVDAAGTRGGSLCNP